MGSVTPTDIADAHIADAEGSNRQWLLNGMKMLTHQGSINIRSTPVLGHTSSAAAQVHNHITLRPLIAKPARCVNTASTGCARLFYAPMYIALPPRVRRKRSSFMSPCVTTTSL